MAENNFEINDTVIESARKTMHLLVDDVICVEMDELETHEFPTGKLFGLEIQHRNALFYLIIKFSKDNRNFICFSPGASDRDKFTDSGELKVPPFFSRWKWHEDFEESTITFADPMLFLGDEMKVGWLIGTKDHWYLETMSEIIRKLAANQNVRKDNILFYGSSGGGYVSVSLATLIKGSKVLVNNAQFFVLNYYPRLVNLALDAIVPSFDGLSKDEVIEDIKYRLDTTELFKRENYAPYITYYVNVKSEFDMTNQALPLVSKYYGLEQFGGLDVIYYKRDSKAPHDPLPNRVSKDLIRSYAESKLYNDSEKSEKELFEENMIRRKLGNESKQENVEKTTIENENGKVKKIFKKLF